MPQVNMTREAWLSAALTRVTRGWAVGADLPENVRVSVGFPLNARGRGAGRITEHHRANTSAGGFIEIFVSPRVGDARIVVEALAAEALLIATGRAAPMDNERPALTAAVDRTLASLPAYPHDALTGPVRTGSATTGQIDAETSESAPQTTRMLRVRCEHCGYTLRASRRWLLVAIPACPADATHGTMAVG